MSARFVLVIVVVAAALEYTRGAPNPSPLEVEKRELAQRFVEFLHEDKEVAGVLDKIDWNGEHLIRNRRQAGLEEDFDNNPIPKEPGFFDRAAKFVTELLQRFLKWINAPENN